MEPKQVLHVLRLPARLTVEETAVLLGFHSQAISVLVKAKLLEPLGGYSRGVDGIRNFRIIQQQTLRLVPVVCACAARFRL